MQCFQTGSASPVRWPHTLKIWAGKPGLCSVGASFLCDTGKKTSSLPCGWHMGHPLGAVGRFGWAGACPTHRLCCGEGLSRAGVEFWPRQLFFQPRGQNYKSKTLDRHCRAVPAQCLCSYRAVQITNLSFIFSFQKLWFSLYILQN